MSTYDSLNSSRTLTAFYRDRSDADRAVSRLLDAGIAQSSVRLVPGQEADSSQADVQQESTGFWDSLADLFFPEEDRRVYAEGLRRGGYLVSVSGISQVEHDRALDILDDEGTINVDEWADSWRAEGWTGGSYVGNASTTTATDTAIEGSPRATSAGSLTGDTEVIPVVEEQLKVGKRDVNAGRVRVRSYVVETPVSETVALRDENVVVERRNVDRPLTDADTAFRDRTVELEEHREEAVVAKEARVREEVVVKKTAAERTETIDDTVRKTEIDIQDTRDKAALNDSLLGNRQSQQLGRNDTTRR